MLIRVGEGTIQNKYVFHTLNMVKKQFPGEFVRVNVDPNKFCLFVARRSNKDTEWTYLREGIPIPKEALNVSTRTVPKDLSFDYLPECLRDFTPTKPQRGRSGRKPSTSEAISMNE